MAARAQGGFDPMSDDAMMRGPMGVAMQQGSSWRAAGGQRWNDDYMDVYVCVPVFPSTPHFLALLTG